MKKITILCLQLLLGLMPIQAQSLSFPLSYGGSDEGGTIVKYDLATQSYKVINLQGLCSVCEKGYSTAEFTNATNGVTYEASNNALYITVKSGLRPIYSNRGYGALIKYDLTTKKTKLIKQLDGEFSGFANALTKVGNKLYGVITYGGSDDSGMIFSVDTTTDEFAVEHDFDGANEGGEPTTKLRLYNSELYGGGKQAVGGDEGIMIYKYNPSTKMFTLLYSRAEGSYQKISDLFIHNDEIYFSYFGGIQKMELYSPQNGYTQLYFPNDDIGSSASSFFYRASDAKWYTTFSKKGMNNAGSIANINFSSPHVTTYHAFQGGALGEYPRSTPINGLAGYMYGTASASTPNSVLYSISPIGIYTVLYEFNNPLEGRKVISNPVLVGGKIYGIAEEDGKYGGGSIWCYNLENGNMTVEADLGYINGKSPIGHLAKADADKDAYLFSTFQGGIEQKGTINQASFETPISTKIADVTSSYVQYVYDGPFYYNGEAFNLSIMKSNSNNSFSAIIGYDLTTGNMSTNPIYIAPDPNFSLPFSIAYTDVIQEGNMLYGTVLKEVWSVDLATKTYQQLFEFPENTFGASLVSITKEGDKVYLTSMKEGSTPESKLYCVDLTNKHMDELFTSPIDSFYVGSKVMNNMLYVLQENRTTGSASLYKADLMATSPSLMKVLDLDPNTIGTEMESNLFCKNDKLYGVSNKGAEKGLGTLFEVDLQSNMAKPLLALSKEVGYNPVNMKLLYEDNNGQGVENEISTEIKFYPNPVKEILTFEKEVASVTLFTLDGKVVLERKNVLELNLSNYPSGVYFLKIKESNRNFIHKLIKR